MQIYSELKEALNEVTDDIEDEEFKNRLRKIIENYYNNSCSESDIDSFIRFATNRRERE